MGLRQPYLVQAISEIPEESGWLSRQPFPVIGIGDYGGDRDSLTANADVVVPESADADILVAAIERHPNAALTLVQVLRAVEHLPVQEGLSVESLAYAFLQSGPEFGEWMRSRDEAPRLITGGSGEPIELARDDTVLRACLNRPEHRNAITVEMRDALIEMLQLVAADDSIARVELSANGPCFSVGGELREFGLSQSSVEAHVIRTVHNPARLIARLPDRVRCHVHGACIGSGIEIPAFAGTLVASRKSFFQLPELTLGLIPGAGGCVSITRRIGRERTGWLALSGRKISSATALEWGLVDEIVG